MDRANGTINLDEARSLFDWWETAGVDAMVDETSRNWLTSSPSSQQRPGSQRVQPPQSQPPEALTSAARTADALPADLLAFHHHLHTQTDLPFAGAGTIRILPSGDPASGLMMLADMPSSEDASSGQIFSGATGLLFDRMLAAIGRDRSSIYLATLSCLAAPGGRLDNDSADACGALARHHVRLAAPRRVLLLGEAATRVLTGLALPAARGRVHAIDLPHEAGSTRVNAVATYHPRYLLQRPSAKAGAWADLQLLIEGWE